MSMNKTDVEYLDYTWNPTKGCSAVSDGCKNCWAKRMSKRLAGIGVRGYSKDDPFAVTCCDWKLDEPLKVKKPSRIGVSFMGDLFHQSVPTDFICNVWFQCWRSKQHQFLMLTKRPRRMRTIVNTLQTVVPNLLLGVSVENQETFDERWKYLRDTPAAVLYISYEPALAPLVLPPDFLERDNVWVICGAETGPGARPMHLSWAVDVLNQCQKAGVPFFFKKNSVGERWLNGYTRKTWEQYPERSES